MLIFFDKDGFVTSLEQMADSVMPEINSLGIHAIQMSHSQGKIGVLCFYQEVVMVIQKTKSMAQPIVFFNNIAEYLEE